MPKVIELDSPASPVTVSGGASHGGRLGRARTRLLAAKPKLLLVFSRERTLHSDSLAKYAAAFSRISHSSVTRRSSDFTLRSSVA